MGTITDENGESHEVDAHLEIVAKKYDHEDIENSDDYIPSQAILSYFEQAGYTVSNNNGEINISGSPSKDIKSVVPEQKVKINTKTSINNGTTLIDIMKQDSDSKVNAINEQTKAINNQNSLLKEQNDLNSKMVKALLSQNDLIAGIISLKSKEVTSVTSQESALKSIANMQNNLNYNTRGQRHSLISLNSNLAKNIEQNKKPLESQQKYHDFQLQGKDTLKDSNGNQIKPLEAMALKNAELGIAQKEDNQIDYISETLDVLEDVFDTASDDSENSNIIKKVIDDFLQLDDETKNKIDKSMEVKNV